MAKVSTAEAAQALRDSKGFITTAAKRLGISRMQLHRIINAHSTVKEALEDAKEEMKDFTESKIYQGIANDNTALIIFYAKTKMKERGYIERQEIDHTGGVQIEVKYADRNGQLETTPPKTD
jgi:cell division ATPase FtsA